jgi:DMSO/TMAO reductase YedYZ heme-binding membrane subunit
MTTFLSFLALILLLLMCIVALIRARKRNIEDCNYWMRRALFFEAQAYELLRNRPVFRRDESDWWKDL